MFQTSIEITSRNRGDYNNGNKIRTYIIIDGKRETSYKDNIFWGYWIYGNASEWDNI